MQAADVDGTVLVVENMEQGTVDDRVIDVVIGQMQRTGDREPRIDPGGVGIVAGQGDGIGSEIDAKDVIPGARQQNRLFACAAADVEYRAVDPALLLQRDDRGLRLVEHPRWISSLVGLAKKCQGGCRVGHRFTSIV